MSVGARSDRTRRVAGAAIIVMAAYVSSRLSGLLRDIAISYSFGTGRQLDAYYAANRVPDLLFQVAAGAAVASAFIPVYTGYLTRGEKERGSEVVNVLFTLAVVGLLPLVLLGIAFAPLLMRVIVPEMPSSYQDLAASLARIMFFAPIFFTIGCFSTSLLNAHGRFFLAALAPTGYNAGIIFGAVVLSHRLGVYGLAIGALLGSILFLVVQVPGLGVIGVQYRPRLDLANVGVRAIGRLMAPRTLGLAVTQVNFLVTLFLASGIAGGIAALNYAWSLTMLPLGVFAMAISTAVFPSLAEHAAIDDRDELRLMVMNALRFILFLTIPSMIGLVTLSSSIVHLIYQRGAFTAVSTEMTADALRFYALGLLGMATVEIVTRAFYALHDTRTPVLTASLGMVVNLGLGVILVRIMGLDGLALATAAASTVEAIALFTLGRKRFPGLHPGDLVESAGKSVGSAVIMGAAVVVWSQLAAPLGVPLGGLLLVGTATLGGGVVYLGATLLLGSPEVARLRRLARRN